MQSDVQREWARKGVYKARKKFGPRVAAGMCVCHLCGNLIAPDAPWDVDHIVPQDVAPHLALVETNWAPAHRRCNRKAGAEYGNAKRGGHVYRRPERIPPPSREW